jgi:hypothetical protein
MTTTTEKYEIQGEKYSFEYTPKDRHLQIIKDGRFEKIERTNPKLVQENLRSIGIYTRIQHIHAHEKNKINVQLKPAASVELRDENGQLVKRIVSSGFEGNVISKRTKGYQYTATISAELLEKVDFTDKQKVSIKPYVENGFLCFSVSEKNRPPQTTLQIKSTGTGVITIPSIFGAMADIDGHGIKWENQHKELYGKTTVEVTSVSKELLEDGFTSEIINVKQEEVGEKEWDQERFQTYFPLEEAVEEHLFEGDCLELEFISVDGELGVKYSICGENVERETAPNIKPIYLFGNGQRNLYLPNALVYGLQWKDRTIQWTVTKEGFISILF